jgi:hypothetical protein
MVDMIMSPARTRASDPLPVRLSINLAPDVAAALKELVSRHGTSLTEEVRRSISLYKFADDEIRSGSRLLVQRGDSLLEIKLL